MSDQELIEKIKDDQIYLGHVYKSCKDYCIRFMSYNSKGSNIRKEELNDIFHDAILIFYEKITNGKFVLTSSIQIYLNSVCRFQLLNLLKSNNITIKKSDIIFDISPNMTFDDSINDTLEPIEDEKERKFKAMEKALSAIKEGGGLCYEILTLFWYQKKSNKEIAETFGYKNANTAKQQKSKCQKRLRTLSLKYLVN